MYERSSSQTRIRFPSSLRLVVTGMARSGTKYMAEVLTAGGLQCTHEKVFGSCDQIDLDEARRESSCFAAPHLGELHPSTAVVHLVRNPFAWLKSWRTKRIDASTLDRVLYPNYSWDSQHDHVIAAMQAWVCWNLLCESWAWARYRVEDLSADQLMEIASMSGSGLSTARISFADALRRVPKDVNTFQDAVPFCQGHGMSLEGEHLDTLSDPTPENLPDCPQRDRFLRLADRYGYRV